MSVGWDAGLGAAVNLDKPGRSGSRPPQYVARAELVLAQPDQRPLGAVGLEPDPLGQLAECCARVQSAAGEQAELVLDMVPVADRAVERRRQRLLRRAQRRGPAAWGERLTSSGGGRPSGMRGAVVDGVTGGTGTGSGGRRPVVLPRTQDLAWEVGKFTPGAQVVQVQLLVRCSAAHPAQARARLHEVLGMLALFSGENWWRPLGPARFGPRWQLYSNAWWRRRSFDRRWSRGDFAPPRRQWVTVSEILPLLKPPTAACEALNVARTGGVVPAAPAALPTFAGQPDVVPLGRVTGPDGTRRLAGVHVQDVKFAALFGKSGFGKTELALVQALARAYAGDGVWFLDPHELGLKRALPYLAHPAVAGRVWTVTLRRPELTDRVACWNPLSMEGRRVEEVQDVVGSVVGAIAAIQGWDAGTAPRARTILSNAVHTLAHLAHAMCDDGRPDLQPTLLQIKALLQDAAWRQEVLPYLAGRSAASLDDTLRFWRTSFPTYEPAAISVVTNAIDRIAASMSLRAFLGHPRGGYDARRAMDENKIVFLCPNASGDDELVSALLIFDLLRAGLSRADVADPDVLATLWAYVDELVAVDSAGHGSIAKILEQLRKYEVRLTAMTQMAMRLNETTRIALLQNRSVLATTAADYDEAAYVAKRMPGVDANTIQGLDQYQYVMSVMHRGRPTAPFRVSGVPLHGVYADYYNPDGVPALQRQIDRNLQRRTVADVLAVQASLEDDIVDHLAGRSPAGQSAEASGVVHELTPVGAARRPGRPAGTGRGTR